MNTKTLTGVVALCLATLASSAHAVSVNPKGIGQALLFPYYTVNKNQDTLISVVNVDDVGKMIQVDALEGYNGRRVASFYLFLSPHDTWTGAISQLSDAGGAVLKTGDTSCTYPAIPVDGLALRSIGYDGTGTDPADGGPASITRVREGFLQIINGADIRPGSPTDVATTHVQTGNPGEGVPPGCASLGGMDITGDEIAPSNGLYGSSTIVNVEQGTFFGYEATALAGFTDVPTFASPGGTPLSLEDANSAEAAPDAATAYLYDNAGKPLALSYQFGIDAVSAVLMNDSIYNDYLVDASLGANTDWVVTFPTKQFYVDTLFGAVPYPPFPNAFQNGFADAGVAFSIKDREEGSVSFPNTSCDSICDPGPPPQLGYEVNVMSFLNVPTFAAGTASGVFGSTLTSFAVPPYGVSGWASMDLAFADGVPHALPGGIDADGHDATLLGLPAIGFMAYNVINVNAQPGVLANYGGAFAHRGTMACTGSSSACAVSTAQNP